MNTPATMECLLEMADGDQAMAHLLKACRTLRRALDCAPPTLPHSVGL